MPLNIVWLMGCIYCYSWLSFDCDWCCIWSEHWGNFWCTKSSKTSASRDPICCMVQDLCGSLYYWRILTIQVVTTNVSVLHVLDNFTAHAHKFSIVSTILVDFIRFVPCWNWDVNVRVCLSVYISAKVVM